MAGPAPKEIQGIPTGENTKIVQFVPEHEEELIKKVTESAQQMEPAFQKEHAIPDASKPIPDSEAFKRVGAERVGAEPELPISMSDMKHHIETAGTIFGGEDDQTHVRTTKGRTPVLMLKRRLFEKAA